MAISKNKHLLRIGELSQATGVSGPTIKHYIQEGLLPKPVKTSKTMAYYDPSCVKKIKLIKTIQQKKFLPLNVIKGLIDSGKISDEEKELQQAFSKSHREYEDQVTVKAADIQKQTGVSYDKIQLMESIDLITPHIRDGQKFYSGVDIQIIKLVKTRSDLGVPFDFNMEVLKIYKSAIADAVSADIRHFVNHITGDASYHKIVANMAEIEASLDEFLVLNKNKLLRALINKALSQMNQINNHFEAMRLFPTPGQMLPAVEPPGLYERAVFLLCKGDFTKLGELGTATGPPKLPADVIPLSILGDLLGGQQQRALEKTTRYIHKPSARLFQNAVAALVYFSFVGHDTGYVQSMLYAKKVLTKIKPIAAKQFANTWASIIAHFICGAIQIVTPQVMDKVHSGITILAGLLKFTQESEPIETGLPLWFQNTVELEIMPEMHFRMNYFLAQGYLKTGQSREAVKYLDRVIATGDPDSPLSEWARMKKLTLNEQLSASSDKL